MAGVGGLARWERGGRVDRIGRPALCVETGGGGGRGAGLRGLLGAPRPPRLLLRLHKWPLGGAAWLGRPREGTRPAGRAASDSRPRAAWRAPAGAVGRRRWGRGRAVTSGRASEQAGGGHIDIDPLPRYEMAHWAAMAAGSLRRRERARDWKEEGGGGPAENATNGLGSCGRLLSLKLMPARF